MTAMAKRIGLEVETVPGTGVLHQLTGVIARHDGNIDSVEIIEEVRLYFEIDLPGDEAQLLEDLRALPVVRRAQVVETLQKIYGKRIIIIGGGAQVGQVAIGAISEPSMATLRCRKTSGRCPNSSKPLLRCRAGLA